MPQFRKKPVVIQAEQWFPDRIVKGVHWEKESRDDGEFLKPYVITAHEQRAYLAPGDWIIPEPKPNRFYPCKPDIFAATYDTIEAAHDDIRELRELSEKCPLPLKVEGECLIVLDSDRRRFTDLGTPEMAQFVLASVNYVRGILAQPVTLSVPTPTGEGEASRDWWLDWRGAVEGIEASVPVVIKALDQGEKLNSSKEATARSAIWMLGLDHVWEHINALRSALAAKQAPAVAAALRKEADRLLERAAALAHPQQGGERDGDKPEIVQHVKSKGLYEVVTRDAQVQTDTPLSDYAFVCVYRNAITGVTWVRPVSEMDDGRFVTLRPAAPTSPSKSSGERDGLTVSTGPYVADEHGTPITGLSWCAAQPHEKKTSHCPACGVGPLEACRGRVPQDDEAKS